MPKLKQNDLSRASRAIKGKIIFLAIVFGVLSFGVLAAQLYKIQIVEHDYYNERAIQQQTRGVVVDADRGAIYDRNYKTLALSADVETVFIAPVDIKNAEQAELIAKGLSEILGMDYDSIYSKTQIKNSYYVSIKRKIERDVADAIRDYKSQHKLNAIKLEPDTKRYYAFGEFASQVIGFVGVDNDGLEGLETHYNRVLTGIAGKKVTAKNGIGTSMPYKFEKLYDAVDGQSLVLTIDETVQHIVEKHLEQGVLDYDIQNRGAAIVMDVDTGEILAMATTGGVDLNNFNVLGDEDRALLEGLQGDEYSARYNELLYANWRNKTVADTYEPGSIFKLITLSMALEEGTVTMEDSFNCSGSVMVKGRPTPISCWKKIGHGHQDLTRALQNSCNPAFVNIGTGVGAERFYSYLQAYGLGQFTDIDLPGEASGLLHDKSYFLSSAQTLAVASFGQTFTVTPIQMITAVSAVVNGGYLMQPHIVREVLAGDGSVAATMEPTVTRQVISEETSKTMCYLMEQVVADGSGRNAQVQGYRIGGKTATSEKIGEANSQGKYVVSFVAVAPADDPKIALLVLLDTPGEKIPQAQRSGGWLAAPLAGKIMGDILPVLGYEPEYTGDELFGANTIVPNLVGLTVNEAKNLLDKKGISVRVTGEGDAVLGQLPSSGAEITTKSQVIIYTEGGSPDGMSTVPNLVGMTPERVNAALTNAGLFLRPSGALGSAASTITAASQDIEAGTEVPRGSVVGVNFLDTNVGDYASAG